MHDEMVFLRFNCLADLLASLLILYPHMQLGCIGWVALLVVVFRSVHLSPLTSSFKTPIESGIERDIL